MKKISKPAEWMKKGVLVEFVPKFLPGSKEGDVFTGRLSCDPWQIRTGDRFAPYVVTIADMDERYQQITGRTVHTIAGIDSIRQIRRKGVK
jgi:hypothetical protein